MAVIWDEVVTATVFTVLGAIIGFLLMVAGAALMPRILNLVTPNIDEEKEMARGNLAVATYFGQVVHAAILGMAIIIAAAIFAGIHG